MHACSAEGALHRSDALAQKRRCCRTALISCTSSSWTAIVLSRTRPAASCTCVRATTTIAIRYPSIVTALQRMPDETVIDGEVVAVDAAGKPSFGLLQNYSSSRAPLLFYAFDVTLLSGKDVMHEPLDARRGLLATKVLPKLKEPIRYSAA